jgi:hypothetical protein
LCRVNVPSKNQYGFQEKCSTYMAIANVIDEITASLDKKDLSIGVFVDLAKAFDTVDHSILLDKLYMYGVRGAPHDLLRSYLSNRMQYTIVNNEKSSLLSVTCGVPQGSVLGPLLFLLYVDDMKYCSNILNFILFADDTNIFYSCSNPDDLYRVVNAELAKLSNWFKANKLSLNLKKTHYIIFGSHNTLLNYCIKIDGTIIEAVQSTKFLGVTIDNCLSWNQHINKLALKLSRNAGVLKRIRYKIDAATALTLYDSMIFSHLSYCAIIWANGSQNKLSKIHKIQKRVLRTVVLANNMAPSKAIFYQLKRLTIYDVYRLQVASFMYSNLRGETPHLFQNQFKTNSQFHPYLTRSAASLHLTRARINLRKTSLSVCAPQIWNSVPANIKLSLSLFTFKRDLKKCFLCSYS